jgi:hypothetical protein
MLLGQLCRIGLDLLQQIEKRYPHALSGKGVSHRQAEPAGATGDDGDLAEQVTAHCLFSLQRCDW